MDLKQRLEEYFQSHPYKKFYAREMKRLNPQLFDEVKKIKLNIPENKILITEKIYFILNGLTERPKCKTCGKNYVTFDSSVFSYRRFRFFKLKFQKHKLSKIFENFDPLKTEKENMISNGYSRIWDCGYFVFEKSYNI